MLTLYQEKFEFKSLMPLNQITILGVDRKPVSVSVNGNTISFDYNESQKKLSLNNIGIDLSSKLEVLWK